MPWSGRGRDGKSAYQLWLDAGHTGDLLHFMDWLVGEQGPQGEPGPPGEDGADSTVPGPKGDKGDTGNTGLTGSQGPQGIQGVPGTNGTNGTNGQGVPVGGTSGQVLAKNSGANYDTGWVTPSAGSTPDWVSRGVSPALAVTPESGFYFDARHNPNVANASGSSTMNVLTAQILVVPRSITVDRICMYQAGTVSGTSWCGLYASLSTGLPGAKILEASFSTNVTGAKEATISYTFAAGVYYVASWYSAGVSCYVLNNSRAIGGCGGLTAPYYTSWTTNNSGYISGLPDPFPTVSINKSASTYPVVGFRVA